MKLGSLAKSAPLIISAVFHFLVFLGIGTVVVFEGSIARDFFTGVDTSEVMGPEVEDMLMIIEEELPELKSEAVETTEPSEADGGAGAVEVIVVQAPTTIPSFTTLSSNNPVGLVGTMAKSFGSGKSGTGSGGSGVLTRFGFKGGDGTGKLQGRFYDYKLDKNGDRATKRYESGQPYDEFSAGAEWGVPSSSEPYSPNVDLFLRTVLFEGVQDVDAGKAFDVPDTQPGLWLAHYYGEVEAIRSGKYRLGGWGDNYLGIGLNGEMILDACDTSQLSRTTAKISVSKGYNVPGKGSCNTFVGPVFELERGRTYRIDIIMGDRGGIFTAGAFVLKDGENFDPKQVFTEYPMLVFGELTPEEYELYPFVSDKVLRPYIFEAR